MPSLSVKVERAEARITGWLIRHSILALRVGLGVVSFWFGVLKFFPGAIPAQGLALNTMDVFTSGLVPESVALILLATLECASGVFSIHRYAGNREESQGVT